MREKIQSCVSNVVASKEHTWVYKEILRRGSLENFIMIGAFHIVLLRNPTASLQSYLMVKDVKVAGVRNLENIHNIVKY